MFLPGLCARLLIVCFCFPVSVSGVLFVASRMTLVFVNFSHLYCLGDSSGWTRGLMMASVMGVLMGESLV